MVSKSDKIPKNLLKKKRHDNSCLFFLAPPAGKRGRKQLVIVLDEVFSTKQGVNRAECTEAIIYDYATGVGHPWCEPYALALARAQG